MFIVVITACSSGDVFSQEDYAAARISEKGSGRRALWACSLVVMFIIIVTHVYYYSSSELARRCVLREELRSDVHRGEGEWTPNIQ
jgi:hypothetical protein